jgi:hypothetical protein
MRLEGLGQLKKFNDLIGNRTCDLPAYSSVSTKCSSACPVGLYNRSIYTKALTGKTKQQIAMPLQVFNYPIVYV